MKELTGERARALLNAYVRDHESEMPDTAHVGDWLPGDGGTGQPAIYTVAELKRIAAAEG